MRKLKFKEMQEEYDACRDKLDERSCAVYDSIRYNAYDAAHEAASEAAYDMHLKKLKEKEDEIIHKVVQKLHLIAALFAEKKYREIEEHINFVYPDVFHIDFGSCIDSKESKDIDDIIYRLRQLNGEIKER